MPDRIAIFSLKPVRRIPRSLMPRARRCDVGPDLAGWCRGWRLNRHFLLPPPRPRHGQRIGVAWITPESTPPTGTAVRAATRSSAVSARSSTSAASQRPSTRPQGTTLPSSPSFPPPFGSGDCPHELAGGWNDGAGGRFPVPRCSPLRRRLAQPGRHGPSPRRPASAGRCCAGCGQACFHSRRWLGAPETWR